MNSTTSTLQIRPAAPRDTDALVALIDGVYHEYGDVIYLAGADADLLDIDAYYRAKGGEFVLLEEAGHVVGSHAVLPFTDRPRVCTFRRLYTLPRVRGSGTGTLLMRWAIDWARDQGLQRVEFWSDCRFTRAHRFFARLGFQKTGAVREMHDGATPYSEFFFERDLTPIP